jgi:hypothetical protein
MVLENLSIALANLEEYEESKKEILKAIEIQKRT